MSDSKVFLVKDNDPEMEAASKKARETFRYFWRELHWERRRIVPGLGLAAVKAPFSDPPGQSPRGKLSVEQMWVNEIDFDGETISGVLLNSPNWLTTVQQGDEARFRLGEISDWMYEQLGVVCGAYTVNLMRSRMKPQERAEHDGAWGLDFGDPNFIRVVPEQKKPGFFQSLFGGKKSEEIGDHPMSVNMVPSLIEELTKDPALVNQADERGWTFLHQESLAGNAPTVKVLLQHGADKKARTNEGKTALQLAQSLKWDHVAALLR